MAYNSAIAAELRRYFRKHKDAVLEHPEVHDGLELNDLRSIKDFEEALIIKTHGQGRLFIPHELSLNSSVFISHHQ